MKPLHISPETAIKLSKALSIPIEQVMHMPTTILLKKLSELEKKINESESIAKKSIKENS